MCSKIDLTKIDWQLINKEHIKQNVKKWVENNKEHVKEKQKIKFTCECGIELRLYEKSRHIKSNKHIIIYEIAIIGRHFLVIKSSFFSIFRLL
jgi:hypothetical protein